jgi:hypothetical protein
MAFQSDAAFAEFLRTTNRRGVFAESAPAVNFLLEERLPALREQSFLKGLPGPIPMGWDIHTWWQTFGNHYSENVALPLRRAFNVSTFADENRDNHLAIESHQDVVRLESLRALHQLYPGDFDTPSKLSAELRNLIQSRQPGQAHIVTDEQRSRLASWVEELNQRRDARPAFAAPFGEIELLLNAPDWVTQLRNVLGLSHLGGSVSKPLPIVMCRYSLSRVERAARKAKRGTWAAAPTVLEAGGVSGPGAAFFPFPNAAASSNPYGFGVTVDLATNGGLDFKSELLHFRLDYTLDDFAMVSDLTDMVTDAQLADARRRHFGLLETDFGYRADVQLP